MSYFGLQLQNAITLVLIMLDFLLIFHLQKEKNTPFHPQIIISLTKHNIDDVTRRNKTNQEYVSDKQKTSSLKERSEIQTNNFTYEE